MAIFFPDEASSLYFRDTPLWEWSYQGFLEALESFWGPTDHVSIKDNSAFRKRYCNILKRILAEEQDSERGKFAALLLQKVM
ncbi:hypothetical protein BC937DRAFT_89374 [Endogone sp. FLAS-F59071]|nr:hypothetical protein BC937DRAFT_89374 [Endogone sp. FLAS-F59071]|eukprot:RUS17891.1 hypothetical protein BC937DRAFT_89374 [Endogone sp. FLAS-F59071]